MDDFERLLNREMNDAEHEAAADAALQVEEDYALNLGGYPVFSCEYATAYVTTLESSGRISAGKYATVGQCVAFALAHSALFLERLRADGPVRACTSLKELNDTLTACALVPHRVHTKSFQGTRLTVVSLRRGERVEEGVGAELSDAFAMAIRAFERPAA